MYDIDFVIPIVDGNDPEWQERFIKYKRQETDDGANDISFARYRPGVNLKYWFRGVEKYAPWVRKIHLITDGQLPDWINLDCPKLNWVKHSDILPSSILPIFNCNPFEVNLHRIPELADHFVYFNDDLFLTDYVSPDRFFRNGLPLDMAIQISDINQTKVMQGIIENDIEIINESFELRQCILKQPSKWFYPGYKKLILKNFKSLKNKRFTAFWEHHLTHSFLKSTFEEVWEQHSDKLQKVTSRFRSELDINQWVFSYWQLAKGNFYPTNFLDDSKPFYHLEIELEEIINAIRNCSYKIILLNDSNEIKDYNLTIKNIENAFMSTLHNKCAFEK